MKIQEFNYTDSKGVESTRIVAVIHEPSDKMFGVDISELNQWDRNYLVSAYDQLLAEHKEQLRLLHVFANTTSKQRQFFALQMSDVTTTQI